MPCAACNTPPNLPNCTDHINTGYIFVKTQRSPSADQRCVAHPLAPKHGRDVRSNGGGNAACGGRGGRGEEGELGSADLQACSSRDSSATAQESLAPPPQPVQVEQALACPCLGAQRKGWARPPPAHPLAGRAPASPARCGAGAVVSIRTTVYTATQHWLRQHAGDLKEGPCGPTFVHAFTCFMKSEHEDKGASGCAPGVQEALERCRRSGCPLCGGGACDVKTQSDPAPGGGLWPEAPLRAHPGAKPRSQLGARLAVERAGT